MERSMWCSQTMVSFTITEKTCAVSVNNLVNHDFTTIPVQPILYHRACLISWSNTCHKNQEQKKLPQCPLNYCLWQKMESPGAERMAFQWGTPEYEQTSLLPAGKDTILIKVVQ